jgi:hypothetical protein
MLTQNQSASLEGLTAGFMYGRKIGVAMGIVKNRYRRVKVLSENPGFKGARKNYFTFYPSRLQAIFARSEDAKSSKELAIPPVLHLQIEQI